MNAPRRARGDDGFGPSIELMLVLVVLFVPIVLITATGAMWFNRYTAGQDLAEDLTRVIITAADPNRPAAGEFDLPVPDRQARVSGELPDLIADYGLDPADVTVTYEVDGVAANLPNNLPDLDGVYRRGMNLTVTVAVTAPAVPIPFIADAAALTITAEHTERIDQHRGITRPGP